MTVRSLPILEAGELFRTVYEYLRPPVRESIVDWCESNIELDPKYSAEPGRLRIRERTPYMAEPLDMLADPGEHEIVLEWAAQTGKSTIFQCYAAYIVAKDPGPALYTLPDQETAKKISRERIHRFFEYSPGLRRYIPRKSEDWGLLRMNFETMPFDMAWAGSPASLAASAKRYLFLDEVDKFPVGGDEGDALRLADERRNTFWNYKSLIGSTPTTKHGSRIQKEFDKTDQQRYHVPCPHCGARQVLRWDQVKWPHEGVHANEIRNERLAWYECIECAGEIRDMHKPAMLRRGVWCPASCEVGPGGEIIGERPSKGRRGYHLSALYSPWQTFSNLAAKWIEAQGNPWELRNFVNSVLAEVWYEKVHEVSEGKVEAAKHGTGYRLPKNKIEPILIPHWCKWVVSGVDVQQHYLWYNLRAWGFNEQTDLLDFGTVGDFERLWEVTMERRFIYEADDARELRVIMQGVDSRYKTWEVYAYARAHADRVRAIRSADHRQSTPYRAIAVDKDRRGKTLKSSLQYWLVDKHGYHDKVAQMIGRESWRLPENIGNDYISQLTSEVAEPQRNRFGQPENLWVLKSPGRANHAWDVEMINVAVSDMLRIFQMRPPGEGGAPARRTLTPATGGFVSAGPDWLERGR